METKKELDKYDLKRVENYFLNKPIFKISNNNEFETLCNTERLDDIKKIKNYVSFQKYDIKLDAENLSKLKFKNIFLTFNKNNEVYKKTLIEFDFKEEIVKINNKTLKVEHDFNYTYNLLKTKIKADNGILGFYKYCLKTLISADSLMLINRLNTMYK